MRCGVGGMGSATSVGQFTLVVPLRPSRPLGTVRGSEHRKGVTLSTLHEPAEPLVVGPVTSHRYLYAAMSRSNSIASWVAQWSHLM